MSGSEALEGFLDKWRTRWPEWGVVEVFVPPAQRRTALAWFALLQEFEDAMNIAGDPLPADAKLGWWGEELRDWSRHRSRHPLGRILEPCEAPWATLAEMLPRLAHARTRPLDQDTAFVGIEPLARALAAVEAAVFGATASAAQVQAIALQLLSSRVQHGALQGVPLRVQGVAEPSVGSWQSELLRRWPSSAGGPAPRRLVSALQQLRLGQSSGRPGRAVHRLRILWIGWRAARG